MAPIRMIVGLGNPGGAYEGTRHNVGFEVVDRLATRHRAGFRAEPTHRIAVRESVGRRVCLVKPTTYMNRSGAAVAAALLATGLEANEIAVVYDDADLEFGRLRLRTGGGHGGHNGVRSLLEALADDDFRRVRLGVRGEGREGVPLADYVLAPFDEDERDGARRMIEAAADAMDCAVDEGFEKAMNRFNGFRAVEAEGEGD